MNCIFCKIINKEMPVALVYENEKVVAFLDINPKSPIHVLIAPKEHIESIASDGSEQKVGDLVEAAKKIAEEKKINGYKLVFNVGRGAGQTVPHLHMHLLAAKGEESMPAQLNV